MERDAAAPEGETPAPSRPPVVAGGNQMMVRLLGSGPETAAPQEDIAGRIAGQLGRGQALPGEVRSEMEGGLGHSFDNVGVHRDAEGATLAKRLGAPGVTNRSG